MTYVVVLSTSQSCNWADTKWGPLTNVTPIIMAHHIPKGTLEYALYIRRMSFSASTNEREHAKREKVTHRERWSFPSVETGDGSLPNLLLLVSIWISVYCSVKIQYIAWYRMIHTTTVACGPPFESCLFAEIRLQITSSRTWDRG